MNTTQAKIKAVKKTLHEHGLSLPPERIKFGEFSVQSGRDLMDELLESSNRPTAVLCVNDFTAIGAIKSASEHGLKIPDDISITGFDDTPLSTAVIPELTTVSQNTYELGRLAVETLHKLISGHKVKKRTILEPKLVVRKSTAAI